VRSLRCIATATGDPLVITGGVIIGLRE